MESYGCAASSADSEMISGLVSNGGHALVGDPSQADLNIIVTCSVKDATANRMIHRIRSLRSRPLVVAGCLPKAERGTVERHAGAASLLGPGSLGRTLQVVDSALAGRREVALEDTDASKVGLPKVRLNPAVGIIEIASGCMSECTFCQTKLAKGGLTSYRPGDIVRQARAEIGDGCKEIWLTSTDNGCYGLDIGTDLPHLVDAVSSIPADFMVRVGMMNPMYVSRGRRRRLLDAFGRSPKVFRFLHVPVQSGSDRILREMRRGHTSETFREIAGEARARFGGRFTISTDVIVGFPTETREDFEMTMGLLEETRPDVVNLSRYSARPGTEAAARPDRVDVDTVRQRSREAFGLIGRISEENNREWIGWTGRVLFDEMTQDGIKGRNFAYKPVYAAGGDGGPDGGAALMGQSRTVRITGATANTLRGEIVAS